MEELCQLCSNYYTKKIKDYGLYTKDSNDHKTGRWITNLLICDTCIKKNTDNIEILSISALDQIPFKIKRDKKIEDLFNNW